MNEKPWHIHIPIYLSMVLSDDQPGPSSAKVAKLDQEHESDGEDEGGMFLRIEDPLQLRLSVCQYVYVLW